jgi:hypothetical protein
VAAAAGSGSASEEAAARLLAAAERLGLGAASPRRPSSAAQASSRRQTRSDNLNSHWQHSPPARCRGHTAALPQVACGLSGRAFKFKLPSQVVAPGAAALAAAAATVRT